MQSLWKKCARATAVAAAVTVVLAGCASGTSSAKTADGKTKLNVAEVSGIVGNAAIHLGVEHGFFEEEGLDLNITQVQNPPAGLAAALGDKVDIAYSPSVSVLTALGQGMPLRVVMGADGYSDDATDADDLRDVDDTSLFVNPKSGISEITDLEGKTIAVPARKAQLEVVVNYVLTEEGVDTSTINWVSLDFQSAVQALKNDTVDAASLVEPFGAQAADAGMTYLAAPSVEFFGGGAVGMWLTSESNADAEPEAIEAFQRAIVRSNQYANDHLDEAKQMSLDLIGGEGDIDDVVDAYWPTEVSESDLTGVNDKLVELGYLREPADLTDVLLPQP